MERKTVEFIYNDNKDLENFNNVIKDSNYDIKLYNVNDKKSFSKILALEHQYGTKLKPLIIVSLNKTVLKVFYQENYNNTKFNKSSIQKLDNYLKHIKPTKDEFYINFINKCKTNNLTKSEVLYYINKLYND